MADNNKEPYFSKEKRDEAIKWLEERWTRRECDCCGSQKWVISDFLIASPNYQGGFHFGGKTAPHLMVTCMRCSNTKFFNAVVMEIISSQKEEKNENEGE